MRIEAPDTGITLSMGLGTRHAAAAAISKADLRDGSGLKGDDQMLHPSKCVLFTAIALACAAMMMPAQVEARGGRGGGGGGGGRGGGMGGSFRGSAGFRGGIGGAGTVGSFRSGGFTPGAAGSWRGGRWGYGGGAGIGLGTILVILLIAYMLGLF